MANVNILYGARIGNGNTIFPGAVIGAIPQDLKFRGEESTAEIGDNNITRCSDRQQLYHWQLYKNGG